MTDAAGFDQIETLINAAWQRSPVTEDATYGAATIRVEVNRSSAEEAGAAALELLIIALASDLDAPGSVAGDTLTVNGTAYTITEVRPVETSRVELLLRQQ